jgi:outer membrane protein OmpA-like peptidoglycan-associated protein
MKRLFVTIAIATALAGCSTPFKRAVKYYDKAEFAEAIPQFKSILEKGGNKASLNAYLGESYRQSNRLGEAEQYYKAAIDAGSSDDKVRYYYAQALKTNGKFAEAQAQFERYSKNGTNTNLVKLAKTEAENAKKIQEIANKKTYFEVTNMEVLNSPAGEFAPLLQDERLLVSATRKKDIYKGTGGGFAGIYAANLSEAQAGKGDLQLFADKINKEGANEACAAFAHDNSFVIFARSGTADTKKGGSNEVDLYICYRTKEGWSEPEIMPYPININKKMLEEGNENMRGSNENAWTSCPAVSPDGKRLYFASNRSGGYGGTDIWTADIRGGKFTNVRNLGKDINTAGNEMFPFISESGNLYFASDGHPSLGGLDNFEAVRVQGKTTIKNLGVPINSPADDFGLVWDKKNETGFMASNRTGGKGDDDIYMVKDVTPDKKIVRYFLEIEVVGIDPTDKNKTEIPLSNAKVQFYQGNETNKKKKLNDFTTDDKGKIKAFPVEMPEDYLMIATASEDYLKQEVEYTTAGKGLDLELLTKPETDTTLYTKVVLDKIVITDSVAYQLEINFDFNKANIRPDAALELDKFVIFLKDNPQLNIELGSHTDAVGDADRNLALSQRRADSTVAYLIKQGVVASRMKAVGYGETRLKENTQAASEINRRTEFKIIGIDKNRRRED